MLHTTEQVRDGGEIAILYYNRHFAPPLHAVCARPQNVNSSLVTSSSCCLLNSCRKEAVKYLS